MTLLCMSRAAPFWLRPCLSGYLDRAKEPWMGAADQVGNVCVIGLVSPQWSRSHDQIQPSMCKLYASYNNFCWSFHVTFAFQGGILLHHGISRLQAINLSQSCPTNLGRSPWMPHNRRRNCWQNGGRDTTSAGWEGALRRNGIFLHAIVTWNTSWLPKTMS